MKKFLAVAIIGLLSVSFTAQASTTFTDDVVVVDSDWGYDVPVTYELTNDCLNVEVAIEFVSVEAFDLYYTTDIFGNVHKADLTDEVKALLSELNYDLPEPEPSWKVTLYNFEHTCDLNDLNNLGVPDGKWVYWYNFS